LKQQIRFNLKLSQWIINRQTPVFRMRKISNPNEIVDSYVSDYLTALGDTLESVFLFGESVTHEYKPGISQINTGMVLSSISVAALNQMIAIQNSWYKKGVTTPILLTEKDMYTSVDTNPIRFLTMKSSYRILYGTDVLANLVIDNTYLRLDCEKELRRIHRNLVEQYLSARANAKKLSQTVLTQFNALTPIFKALLVLSDKAVPTITSEVIGNVEVLYDLGASVLTDIFTAKTGGLERRNIAGIFAELLAVTDKLIQAVDSMN